jgi:hypothetical protein
MCAELGTPDLSSHYHKWGRGPEIFLYAGASQP